MHLLDFSFVSKLESLKPERRRAYGHKAKDYIGNGVQNYA